MRPSEVVLRATRYLERHDVDSPRATAEVLLQHVLRTDRAGLYASPLDLSTAEAKAFGRALCRRCTGTPVQHLTGRQAFRHIELEVRPGVFVPRPETETLVDVALEMVADLRAPVVVDVGTGTGAIGLAIKDERPDARVVGTDLSPEAVALARANAERLGLDVEIIHGDLLDTLPSGLRGGIDLVAGNPPYVDPDELVELPPEVQADPQLALVGGIDVHRRLVAESPVWLRSESALVVEVGATQGREVAALFEDGGFGGVVVHADLAGRDRVVAGRLRG